MKTNLNEEVPQRSAPLLARCNEPSAWGNSKRKSSAVEKVKKDHLQIRMKSVIARLNHFIEVNPIILVKDWSSCSCIIYRSGAALTPTPAPLWALLCFGDMTLEFIRRSEARLSLG